MNKDKIVAAINGGNGRKVQGIVGDFNSPDGKNVVVDFTEHKSDSSKEVPYEKVYWPNHKLETAAQTKRANAITSWKSTNGANNAQEALQSKEFAAFVPAD